MKEVNRQMIAIFNTLLTVAGAFAFGFFGINYAYPALQLNFETRIILGLCTATVVFFADLYFITKSMDQTPAVDEPTKKAERISKSTGQSLVDQRKKKDD